MSSDTVKIENVSRIFPNGKCALQNINLRIKQGEFALVCGRNGSGKSVLMSLIAKLDEPTTGTISAPPAGLVFQNADAQILGETPEEDILFGLRNMPLSKDEIKFRLEKTLTDCGLKEKRDFQARLLSEEKNAALQLQEFLQWKKSLSFLTSRLQILIIRAYGKCAKYCRNLKTAGKP